MISVIIPIYNVEKYIEKSVGSVLQQTYKDLEVLLIDDGSTDRSGELCDIISKKDNRVKVLHKSNGGVASARNEGLKMATGSYIGFVDPDDYILPQMYEYLLKAIESEDADIAMSGFKTFSDLDDAEEYAQKGILESFEEINKKVLNHEEVLDFPLSWKMGDCVLWNKLFKKDLLTDSSFELLSVGSDKVFTTQYIFKNPKVIDIDIDLYMYIVERKDSLRRKKRSCDNILSDIKMIRRLAYYYKINNLSERQNKIFRDCCNTIIDEYLVRKHLFSKEKNNKEIIHLLLLQFKEVLNENSNILPPKITLYTIFNICPELGGMIRKKRSNNQYLRMNFYSSDEKEQVLKENKIS